MCQFCTRIIQMKWRKNLRCYRNVTNEMKKKKMSMIRKVHYWAKQAIKNNSRLDAEHVGFMCIKAQILVGIKTAMTETVTTTTNQNLTDYVRNIDTKPVIVISKTATMMEIIMQTWQKKMSMFWVQLTFVNSAVRKKIIYRLAIQEYFVIINLWKTDNHDNITIGNEYK